MAAVSSEGDVLRRHQITEVVGLVSQPHRNGQPASLLRQLDNGRWETTNPLTGEEAAFKPSNLRPLSPLSEALLRMLSSWALLHSSARLVHLLVAHRFELPLLHLAIYNDIRRVLPRNSTPPHTLSLLQDATRAAPGLELCGPLDTHVCRPPLPAEPALAPPAASDGELLVLRIAASPSRAPSLLRLPSRPDFLEPLRALLGAAVMVPRPVWVKAGQRISQPTVYFSLPPDQDGQPQHPEQESPLASAATAAATVAERNAMASALVGLDVHGDALLSAVEADDAGEVQNREEVTIAALVRLLYRKSECVGSFVASARAVARASQPSGGQGLPLLLAAEGVPRAEGWGTPEFPPRAVLNQYVQKLQGAGGADAVGACETVASGGSGFVGVATLPWPSALPLPVGAERCEGDARQVRLRSEVKQRKKGSRQADLVVSAEDAAAVLLLQALHARAGVAAPGRLLDLWPMPPVRDEADALPVGSRLVFSYRLSLSAPPHTAVATNASVAGADSFPACAAGDTTNAASDAVEESGSVASVCVDDGLLVESAEQVPLLVGSGGVNAEVEDWLSELAASERTGKAAATVELLGTRLECELLVEVLKVEPPAEVLHGGNCTEPGQPTHAEQRLQCLQSLLSEWQPTSIADVGCGEAKLLSKLLVTDALPGVRSVLAVDATSRERSIRRAKKTLGDAVTAAAQAGRTPPKVWLLRSTLSDFVVSPPPEVLLLVEVIEHLDPHELQQLGPVLLSRCAPRRLVVTTPNKEYNLNWIKPPGRRVGDPNPDLPPDPPPVSAYPLRNSDHRFEWTREEFRAWATEVARTHSYDVRFVGVGGGPLDEKYVTGSWHGPGPHTQVAVFERIVCEQSSEVQKASFLELQLAPAVDVLWTSSVVA